MQRSCQKIRPCWGNCGWQKSRGSSFLRNAEDFFICMKCWRGWTGDLIPWQDWLKAGDTERKDCPGLVISCCMTDRAEGWPEPMSFIIGTVRGRERLSGQWSLWGTGNGTVWLWQTGWLQGFPICIMLRGRIGFCSFLKKLRRLCLKRYKVSKAGKNNKEKQTDVQFIRRRRWRNEQTESEIYNPQGSGRFCESGGAVSLCNGFKQGQRGGRCQVSAGDYGFGAESGSELKHLCRWVQSAMSGYRKVHCSVGKKRADPF